MLTLPLLVLTAVTLVSSRGETALVTPTLVSSNFPYGCYQYREDNLDVAANSTSFLVTTLGKSQLLTTDFGTKMCPLSQNCKAFDPPRYLALRSAQNESGPLPTQKIDFWLDGYVLAVVVNFPPVYPPGTDENAEIDPSLVNFTSLLYDYYNSASGVVSSDQDIGTGQGSIESIEFCFGISSESPNPSASFTPLPVPSADPSPTSSAEPLPSSDPTPSPLPGASTPSVCTETCSADPSQNKCHFTTSCAPGPGDKFYMCACRPGYKPENLEQVLAWRFNSSDWTLPGHDHRVYVSPGEPCNALCDGVFQTSDPDKSCEEIPIYDFVCGSQAKMEMLSLPTVVGENSSGTSRVLITGLGIFVTFATAVFVF